MYGIRSMDLNHVLVWIVALNTVVALTVQWRRFGTRYVGWLVAHGLVLIVLAASWLVAEERAGMISLAVWLPLVGLPMLLGRWLGSLLIRRQYDAARRVARMLAVLHPADGWRSYPSCIDILGLIQSGNLAAAEERLAGLSDPDSNLARFATVHLLRAEGRWEEVRQWIERQGDPSSSAISVELALQYERALGETGCVEAMVLFHRQIRQRMRGSMSIPVSDLQVAAFTGRREIVAQLLAGSFRSHPAEVHDYWRAIASAAAGDRPAAEMVFHRLAVSGSVEMQAACRRRLENPLPAVEPDRFPSEARAALAEFEESLRHELRYRTVGVGIGRRPLVVPALVVANLAAFALELRGGTEDLEHLVSLGALVVVGDGTPVEWWRVFTAGFLHFGAVHLAMNLLGICILGSYMERVWGRWRLLVCYLAAMCGGNVVAQLFIQPDPGDAIVMLGASGGVMGIIGSSLGFSLMAWLRNRVAVLGRQISMFLFILAIQMVFDVFTPVVSSTIHMSGFALGFATAVAISVVVREDLGDDKVAVLATSSGGR